MILGGISKTSEREKFMSFSKSIRYDDVVLVSYKSQLYEGMTLGYQYSSSHFELATNIVDKYHFSSNAMAYVSAKDMINALKSHKVDAILVNSSIAEYQLKNYYITRLGYTENSYIGFNHEDNKLKVSLIKV